jgi:hypothetical protein
MILVPKIYPIKDGLAIKWPLIKIHNDNIIRILSLCIQKEDVSSWLFVLGRAVVKRDFRCWLLVLEKAVVKKIVFLF